jgi:Zn finger protein HypA/HybF involved in hydrogenase expression
MIKVIRKKLLRKIKCRQCLSVLSYEPEDLKGSFILGTSGTIECPLCGNHNTILKRS